MKHRESTLTPAALERHYSVPEIAKLWCLSDDTVRRIFENEPGVLEFGAEESSRRRRYRSIRVPESVLIRVHGRLQQ